MLANPSRPEGGPGGQTGFDVGSLGVYSSGTNTNVGMNSNPNTWGKVGSLMGGVSMGLLGFGMGGPAASEILGWSGATVGYGLGYGAAKLANSIRHMMKTMSPAQRNALLSMNSGQIKRATKAATAQVKLMKTAHASGALLANNRQLVKVLKTANKFVQTGGISGKTLSAKLSTAHRLVNQGKKIASTYHPSAAMFNAGHH